MFLFVRISMIRAIRIRSASIPTMKGMKKYRFEKGNGEGNGFCSVLMQSKMHHASKRMLQGRMRNAMIFSCLLRVCVSSCVCGLDVMINAAMMMVVARRRRNKRMLLRIGFAIMGGVPLVLLFFYLLVRESIPQVFTVCEGINVHSGGEKSPFKRSLLVLLCGKVPCLVYCHTVLLIDLSPLSGCPTYDLEGGVL